MNKKDSLGDRIKGYENINRLFLPRRIPVIIRLDGRAFHSFTRGFQKPFDMVLMKTMWDTTKELCATIPGIKLGYTQSDEIQLLVTDNEKITTAAWFDKNINKITSLSAAKASIYFNKHFKINAEEFAKENPDNKEVISIYRKRYDTAEFDSRMFLIPEDEVCNAFIWRQQDATRNAVQMVAQYYFSHKQLQKKNTAALQEMLFTEKNINFNNLDTCKKRGVCIIKETYDKKGVKRSRWIVDEQIPIFTQCRDYIDIHLNLPKKVFLYSYKTNTGVILAGSYSQAQLIVSQKLHLDINFISDLVTINMLPTTGEQSFYQLTF